MYILLIVGGLWCFLHSLLISNSVLQFSQTVIGVKYKYYRIVYNIFSIGTLVPVLLLERRLGGEEYFNWNGNFRILQLVLFMLSFLLFYSGAKYYNLREFLGFRQLEDKSTSGSGIAKDGQISLSGIHGIIRHPWYLGSLIFIWLREINKSTLATNIIFTLYLFIGAYLEERKLTKEYGKGYREYKKLVSMWFPWKWIKRHLWLK